MSDNFDYREFINIPGVDKTLWETGYFCYDYEKKEGILSKPLRELGVTLEDMASGDYEKRIHHLDYPTYRALWERLHQKKENELHCEFRIASAPHVWRWILTHVIVIERTNDGKIRKIVGTNRDITARKYAESYMRRELMDTKRRLDLSESIRLTSHKLLSSLKPPEGQVSEMDQLKQIIGFDYAEIFVSNGKNMEKLVYYPQDKLHDSPYEKLMDRLEISQYPFIIDEKEYCAPFSSLLAVPLRFSGRFIGFVLLWHNKKRFYTSQDLYPVRAFSDILAVAVKNSQAFDIPRGDTDSLTGFMTRKSVMSESEILWSMMEDSKETAAVAMIDIDGLKQINREFGKETGDRVLSRLSDLFRLSLRKDVLLGRYGGEEFIVVIPDCNCSTADIIFERLRVGCELMDVDGVNRPVTISLGVCCSTADVPFKVLIDRSCEALKQAKKKGRNTLIHL